MESTAACILPVVPRDDRVKGKHQLGTNLGRELELFERVVSKGHKSRLGLLTLCPGGLRLSGVVRRKPLRTDFSNGTPG